MNDLLKRLDTWLYQNRPEYYQGLAPGASEEELREVEQVIGVRLPEDFKDFLRWRNGQTAEEDFLQGYELLPTNFIMGLNQSFNEFRDWNKPPDWWNPSWVPFLADGSGTCYCIDMAGSFGGRVGQIVWYLHDDYTREVSHESFRKWLESNVIAMEKDRVIDDEITDIEAYLRLMQELNPGYPIYHDTEDSRS